MGRREKIHQIGIWGHLCNKDLSETSFSPLFASYENKHSREITLWFISLLKRRSLFIKIYSHLDYYRSLHRLHMHVLECLSDILPIMNVLEQDIRLGVRLSLTLQSYFQHRFIHYVKGGWVTGLIVTLNHFFREWLYPHLHWDIIDLCCIVHRLYFHREWQDES
jgi:hypothetical protein